MKRHILPIIVATVCACLVSCSNAVPFQSLPAPARTFISTHYADMPVPFAKAELCEYEVVLPNGTEIEFTRKGEWKKIEKGPFGGYELELANDAELRFSKEGMLKSISF